MYGAVNLMVWEELLGTEKCMELSILWCGKTLHALINVKSCQSLGVGGAFRLDSIWICQSHSVEGAFRH